jgi:hypothetical protein
MKSFGKILLLALSLGVFLWTSEASAWYGVPYYGAYAYPAPSAYYTVGAPVYYAPAYTYVPAAPVYYAPAPAPVYYVPARVIYAPAPAYYPSYPRVVWPY